MELTEFNSNLATLERIDKMLRLAADSHFEEDLFGYFKNLRNLRQEILVKMKGNKETIELKNKMDNDYRKLKSLYLLYKNNLTDIGLVEDFEEMLDNFEFKLRMFADEKGMLLRDAQDLDGL